MKFQKSDFKLLATYFLALLFCGMVYYFSPMGAVLRTGIDPITESFVRGMVATYEPDKMPLGKGFNFYVQRHRPIKDLSEVGIITLNDGSIVKYWFVSHHQARDMGGTLFRFEDGKEIFISGYFCCELTLPEEGFSSIPALQSFLVANHGRTFWH